MADPSEEVHDTDGSAHLIVVGAGEAPGTGWGLSFRQYLGRVRSLRSIVANPANHDALGRMLAEAGAYPHDQLSDLGPEELGARVLAAISQGALQIVPRRSSLRPVCGAPVELPTDELNELVEDDGEVVTALSWISIEIVNYRGEPIDGVSYSVTPSSGDRLDGSTDDQGRGRHDEIAEGGCTLSFSDLAGQVRRWIRSAPEPAPEGASSHAVQQLLVVPSEGEQELRLQAGAAHRLVVQRPVVRVLELEDVCFETACSVLLPAGSGSNELGEDAARLRGLGAIKAALEHAKDREQVQVLVVGHTDAVGSEGSNLELSEARADNVWLYLGGDRGGWAGHCAEHATTADLQSVLDWVAHTHGVDCLPGEIDDDWGPQTERALEGLRRAYNEHLGGTLPEHGAPGVADWEAIYDVYDVTLAALLGCDDVDELADFRGALAPCDPPRLGCGEQWPRDGVATVGARAADRRVELMFFDPDEVPELPGDPPGATLYDPVQARHHETEYLPAEAPVLSGLEVTGLADLFRLAKGQPLLPEDPQAFKVTMKSLFGDDIGAEAIEKMRVAFRAKDVPPPKWEISNDLPTNVRGAYADGTVYVDHELARAALIDPERRWQLFLVMLEEFGHHLDHLLREEPSDSGQPVDALGDEGTRFAAFYVHFHRLLYSDVEVAEITTRRLLTGEESTSQLDLSMSELGTEGRAREVWRAYEEAADSGVIIVDGKEVETEFYKIEGQGAVHERITEEAAKATGLVFDYRLDKGCAWPDVPTTAVTPPVPKGKDVSHQQHVYNTPATDYAGMLVTFTWAKGSPAYRSHNGDLQYWHAMSPGNHLTNREVRNLIIDQHALWWEWALARIPTGLFDKKSAGLFHLGKILHTVQDSFSDSHTIRARSPAQIAAGHPPNSIISFQDYTKQDSGKHGHADKEKIANSLHDIIGAQDALEASKGIMKLYAASKPFIWDVRKFLIEEVFPLSPLTENDPSGEVDPKYAK